MIFVPLPLSPSALADKMLPGYRLQEHHLPAVLLPAVACPLSCDARECGVDLGKQGEGRKIQQQNTRTSRPQRPLTQCSSSP